MLLSKERIRDDSGRNQVWAAVGSPSHVSWAGFHASWLAYTQTNHKNVPENTHQNRLGMLWRISWRKGIPPPSRQEIITHDHWLTKGEALPGRPYLCPYQAITLQIHLIVAATIQKQLNELQVDCYTTPPPFSHNLTINILKALEIITAWGSFK